MKHLFLALLLAAAAPARASLEVEGPAAPAPAPSFFYEGPHFGMQIDAGVPSGGAVQLVARPWRFLRLGGGAAYNMAGMGVKGSLTLLPFHWIITPTLGLEAGRFFPADASRFVSDTDLVARQLLSRVGYDYLSADLGIEIGSENRFVFYVRAGLSQLYPSVGNVTAALQAADPTLRVTAADPTLRARIPCVRVGFLLYMF